MGSMFDDLLNNKLRVTLDALAYYLETSEKRMEHLLKLKASYEKKLDYYVVIAQLDVNMKDKRDETSLTLSLIAKKLECFEEYLKDAEILYKDLFACLESSN